MSTTPPGGVKRRDNGESFNGPVDYTAPLPKNPSFVDNGDGQPNFANNNVEMLNDLKKAQTFMN